MPPEAASHSDNPPEHTRDAIQGSRQVQAHARTSLHRSWARLAQARATLARGELRLVNGRKPHGADGAEASCDSLEVPHGDEELLQRVQELVDGVAALEEREAVLAMTMEGARQRIEALQAPLRALAKSQCPGRERQARGWPQPVVNPATRRPTTPAAPPGHRPDRA